jgi:hypothetical protein
VAGFAVTASASGTSHSTIPTIVPSTATPQVGDGEVETIVKVGTKIIAGGTFTTVTNRGSSTAITRNYIMAFDAATGVVDTAFAPVVNGEVMALEPGPVANTVYIGGRFTTVNGGNRKRVALVSTIDGSLSVGFFPNPAPNGPVSDIALAGSRLYIAGSFTNVDNVTHNGLASINPSTGHHDPYMNLQVAGHHNYNGTGAMGAVGVDRFDLSPDKKRMIAVGNFKTVSGTDHDQAVLVDLTTTTNAKIANWQTNRFDDRCGASAYDGWVRDAAFSPDGSYFVIAATGGNFPGSLCDSASRWNPNAAGTGLRETWSEMTGGDSLLSVAITGPAVYVGGHQRWMNNTYGLNTAGPGAVGRAGLAALDPLNGLPLAWNPGRNSRGNGARALYATSDGLYIGSDTDYIGNFQYPRAKIAFFPLAGGAPAAPTNVPSLPAGIYFPKGGMTQPAILFRMAVGGPQIAANDGGPAWMADNTTNSQFRVSGGGTTIVNFATNVAATEPGAATSVPIALYNSQRRDQPDTTDMQWNIPVKSGTHVTVRLYFAERLSPQPAPGDRVFDVSMDGAVVANDLDIVATSGYNTGTMREFHITADGNLDIDFSAVSGLPMLTGIEILNEDSALTGDGIGRRAFSGTTIGGATNAGATDANDWLAAKGAFWVGGNIWYTQTDGNLYKRPFNGTTFGWPQVVNPYSDPLWDDVNTGSGTTTYAGVKSNFYAEIPNVTGMFYSGGKLFYAVSGQNTLFWRFFSPDSGTIGADKFTVNGSSGFSTVAGVLFATNGKLYFSKTDGNLYSIAWTGGSTSGSATLLSGPSKDGKYWKYNAGFWAP